MLFLGRVRKFARKTRVYRWVYARLREGSYKLIQKMVDLCMAYRNIEGQEVTFLDYGGKNYSVDTPLYRI